MERIKRKQRAITAIATAGDRDCRGQFERTVRGFAAVGKIQCVDALVTVPPPGVCSYIFCLRDNVQNFCERVDHWSSDDTDIRLNVTASHVHGGGPSFSGRDQLFRPIRHAGIRIGVEGVNGVVGGGGKNHVVRATGDGKIGYPESLRINRGVYRAGKQFCERGGTDVRRSQRKFLRVDADAGGIVVIGGHAGEVRDADGGSSGLGDVESAGGGDRVHAGIGRRIVCGGSGRDIGEGAARGGPSDTLVGGIVRNGGGEF